MKDVRRLEVGVRPRVFSPLSRLKHGVIREYSCLLSCQCVSPAEQLVPLFRSGGVLEGERGQRIEAWGRVETVQIIESKWWNEKARRERKAGKKSTCLQPGNTSARQSDDAGAEAGRSATVITSMNIEMKRTGRTAAGENWRDPIKADCWE
jgi:hypothetical protein